METEKKYHVIGRGFSMWHAVGVNVRSSGGDLDPYTYWTGEKCAGYRQTAVEGALVYDAHHLERDSAEAGAFIALVVTGPTVDPALRPNEVKRFSDRDTLAMMAPGLGGGYATLAKLAKDPNYAGLDSVGVAVFEGLLSKIPGIKIGHVHNEQVVWDPS